MIDPVKVLFKPLHNDATIPDYKTSGSACKDITAVINEPHGRNYIYIYPDETRIIKTGFAVEVPEGYELQIRARSGIAAQGVMCANGVGTVDSDYRGEVGVILTNTSKKVFTVHTGDRIAQCKLERVIPFTFEVAELLTDTDRGEGGYGSTGR